MLFFEFACVQNPSLGQSWISCEYSQPRFPSSALKNVARNISNLRGTGELVVTTIYQHYGEQITKLRLYVSTCSYWRMVIITDL